MLLPDVQRYIERHRLLRAGASVLVGLSGGVDSVVLLHVLHCLGYSVQAAHVNYELRDAASEADEHFVRSLCEAWAVPVHVLSADPRSEAERRGCSLQASARDLRYAFFRRLVRTEALEAVAVAHHRDDQVETVLLNLFRGTGPEGLAGMPPRRPLDRTCETPLIRPLLGASRRSISSYARAEGLDWREDASNDSLSYRRNVLRRRVLPVIREVVGEASLDHIARSADLMRAYVDAAFASDLSAHFDAAARALPGGEGRLDAMYLGGLPPVWRRRVILEALRRWRPEAPQRASLAKAIEGLLEAQPGRRVAFKSGEVWRERDGLYVRPSARQPEPLRSAELAPAAPTHFDGTLYRLELLPRRPAALDAGTPHSVVVNADRLCLPLTVRRWQPGDRLQPLGMEGTKKVSDLLTDARVPTRTRQGVAVVLSGEEVVWVVGHRLAHPFRVRQDTLHFAKISLHPEASAG